MRVDQLSFLPLLYICHLFPVIHARTFRLNALTVPDDGTRAGSRGVPSHDEVLKRSNNMVPIHGLPHPLQGIFQYASTFQPPLPIASFTKFFSDAAKAFHNDDTAGRFYHRFTCGSLALEVTAITQIKVDGKLKYIEAMVLKEFVEATALWLLDAAQKGWTEFFQARVVDKAVDSTVYYIHLSNTWDSWMQQTSALDFFETLPR